MNASGEAADTRLDPQRLRYVTENFHALQGLTSVALGILVLRIETESLFARNTHYRWLSTVVILACAASIRFIPKYYEHRFGWIKSRSAKMSNRGVMICVCIWLALFIFGRQIANYGDPVLANLNNQLHAMISVPDHRVNFWPTAFWCLLLFVDIERSLRGRLVARSQISSSFVVALTSAVVCFYPLHHREIMQLMVWKFLNAGWFGITLIAMGLLDHLTLIHLMPKRPQEENEVPIGIRP
jgi:magnesium-transporting ATPase (P-type)